MANVMKRVFPLANVIRRLQLPPVAIHLNSGHLTKRAVASTTEQRRLLSLSARQYQQTEAEEEETGEEGEAPGEAVRAVHDVETSKRYMASKAYQLTYGTDPVWVPYRRNHKGHFPPTKTRKTCIRKKRISTGNPCPICRDEYLVLHPENPGLLNQFINKKTGGVLSYSKTGVCQTQHKNILIAVEKAWDLGTIEKPVPFRYYDYSTYYPQLKKQ